MTAVAALSVMAVCVFFGAVLHFVFPFPEERLHGPASRLVLDNEDRTLRRFLAEDGYWRFPITLDEMSPWLAESVPAVEDRWFYWHPGVNPLAIVRAAFVNIAAGRIVSGASTIPMQIARMAEPRPRTLGSKCIEAFRAIQLTLKYTKTELLEIYLNMAPFGGNVVGVGAAARVYFNKSPKDLSLGEAALLSALPRAPNGYNPVSRPKAALKVRNRVLDRLNDMGVFPADRIIAAKKQPLIAKRHPAPMRAPHFSLFALNSYPEAARLKTTIDSETQAVAEKLIARRIPWLRSEDIGNAAVVVLDRKRGALLAMAGSASFFESDRQGQVNNTISKRSPGSTLKPFLYALALDRGVLAPGSMLMDVPTDFAGYAPRNYGRNYQGRVPASYALSQSLNVPAVRLLSKVGVPAFLSTLRKGGLRTLDKPAATYGLPLALGGGGVRLIDLTNLYAALARGGEFQPIRMLTDEPAETSTRIFSKESSALVTEILAQVTRPDMPDAWRLARDIPAVAWKTGTSFGHRDAWAVGFGATRVIGVWVGNPDGTPRKGISGATHAGPLLFDLFRALEKGRELPKPLDLNMTEVRVCAVSGKLPGPNCKTTRVTRILPGVTNLGRCDEHQRMFVDMETGKRLMGDCLMSRKHKSVVMHVPPAELMAWLRSQGKDPRNVPPLHDTCTDAVPGTGPRIISPSAKTPYLMRAGIPAKFQRVALKAMVPAGVERVWWYVDGELAGSGGPSRTLFATLEPGEHVVTATDDQGRTDSVTYTVVE